MTALTAREILDLPVYVRTREEIEAGRQLDQAAELEFKQRMDEKRHLLSKIPARKLEQILQMAERDDVEIVSKSAVDVFKKWQEAYIRNEVNRERENTSVAKIFRDGTDERLAIDLVVDDPLQFDDFISAMGWLPVGATPDADILRVFDNIRTRVNGKLRKMNLPYKFVRKMGEVRLVKYLWHEEKGKQKEA